MSDKLKPNFLIFKFLNRLVNKDYSYFENKKMGLLKLRKEGVPADARFATDGGIFLQKT